jgi:hypothetical protein
MDIATYEKYLPELYVEFPDVNEKSIRDLTRHGMTMLGFFLTKGHDVKLNNNMEDLYYYIGQVSNNLQKRYEICRKKHRRKVRLLHSLMKIPYSGYMYFSLTNEQYEQHLAGELIDKVYLFKSPEEAKIFKLATHHLKIKMENPRKWMIITENYETSGAEHV